MATKDQNGNINVKIARGMSISAEKEHALQKKPGGSNVGEYANVSPENFAGTACGLPGAYPMDTIERARSALSYAHNAKDPECIKAQVYKKWPELKDENK